MNEGQIEEIIRDMEHAIVEASKEVMRIYREGFHVETKSDNSPVTDADLASNRIIHSHLDRYTDIGWLSEEDQDDSSRMDKKYVFVVDPLDGTQDFVNHDNTFAINLALVKENRPLIAFIGVPFLQSFAYAYRGRGAYVISADHSRSKLHVSDRRDHLVYLASKTNETGKEKLVIERHQDRIESVIRSGASTKAILLALGKGDCSVRYTDKTKEWDICASDLIVQEAGGIFLDTKKKEFLYNKKDVVNHDGYCMFNMVDNMDLLDGND